MENGSQTISEKSQPTTSRKPTAGVSERPVRIFPWQVSEPDSKETDHPSLERYLESHGKRGQKIDPNGLSMRMLRVCSPQIGGGLPRNTYGNGRIGVRL